MNKLYLIALSATVDREAVKDYLNTNPSIVNWFYGLPYSIFVQSPLSARKISKLIEDKFGNPTLLVAEITSNYWGRMDKSLWQNFPPSSNLNEV